MCTSRLGAIALVGFLTTATPGFAIADPSRAENSERLSAVVTLSDLDLKTPAGARAAHDRIQKEALRLCRKFSDSRRISERETLADCMRQAAKDATPASVGMR
jgi:UrcA family protein